jgi:SAM-dependent methyltransferase
LLEELNLGSGDGGLAVDLGAGSGFQSIPLAEAGYRVYAVDTCQTLLEEIKERNPEAPIAPVNLDIIEFIKSLDEQARLIICMGDTLTHLSSEKEAFELIDHCHGKLNTGGTLILEYRDMTTEPDSSEKVIPIRQDDDRLFTCILDYNKDTITVTDLLYVRDSHGAWQVEKSSYDKLRLYPETIRKKMERMGLKFIMENQQKGMVTQVVVR